MVSRIERAWKALEAVNDPEIPVLTVLDLGIVRAIEEDGEALRVSLTPTYSGCPATRLIGQSVRSALENAGLVPVIIRNVLTPPWTTDWITAAGHAKLRAFGIAPPTRGLPLCPRCNAADTEEVSPFGSTPCKSHWRCRSCLEPFDHFKCH